MDTKNNSDSENTFPINFQPMPKRFMAWDKHQKDWVTKFLMPSTSDQNSDDYTCPLTLGTNSKGEIDWLNNDQLILCQSTNLFDKDGKEIFEGSIVRYNPSRIHPIEDDSVLLVYWYKDSAGFAIDYHGMICRLDEIEKYCEVIGHILSNPELLEENQNE